MVGGDVHGAADEAVRAVAEGGAGAARAAVRGLVGLGVQGDSAAPGPSSRMSRSNAPLWSGGPVPGHHRPRRRRPTSTPAWSSHTANDPAGPCWLVRKPTTRNIGGSVRGSSMQSARLKNYKILRDYRQPGDGLHHAVQAVARTRNLTLASLSEQPWPGFDLQNHGLLQHAARGSGARTAHLR